MFPQAASNRVGDPVFSMVGRIGPTLAIADMDIAMGVGRRGMSNQIAPEVPHSGKFDATKFSVVISPPLIIFNP